MMVEIWLDLDINGGDLARSRRDLGGPVSKREGEACRVGWTQFFM